MERKGHGGGGPIRGAPAPPRAPLPSWGTHIMGTQRQGRESSTRATKLKSGRGKREHCRELTLFETEMGVRRGEHSKASIRESPQGEAACPVRMWGKHKHPAQESSRTGWWWLWKDDGRKIPSDGPGVGKAVSCERAWHDVTGEGTTELPPTEKVREHENVVLIRWGSVYTHRSEQLPWSWKSK